MLLSCFSVRQPGVALLKASLLTHRRALASGETGKYPRNGLALANWPFLPAGKDLIFLNAFVSLTMIPAGKK